MTGPATPRDLSRFAELTRDALCVLDRHGYVQYANPAFARMAGCLPAAVRNTPFVDYAHPEDRPAVASHLDAVSSAASPVPFAFRIAPPGGPGHRVECTFHPDGDRGQVMAVVRDAPGTPTREAIRVATDSLPCATVVVDARGTITMVNRATDVLFGYDEGDLIGQSVEVLIPEDLRQQHVSHRIAFDQHASARPMGSRRDLTAQRRDGSLFPVEVGLSPMRTPDGMFVVSAIVDLSERKRAEWQIAQQAEMLKLTNLKLEEMASTDSLTSLWNRRAFLDQLDVQLEQTVRKARPLSVLLLDVDNFKAYNDLFGHLAGDEVLRGFSDVLRTAARRSDYVARVGGEEFGVILPETDGGGAVLLAERFRQAIANEQWPRRTITASIGATTVAFSQPIPRPTSPDYADVLSAADRALYHSKEHGRNRVTHAGDLGLTI